MSKIKAFFRNEYEFCKSGMVWPTNQECTRKTAVVIGVVVIVAAILVGADALIGLTMSAII